MTIQQMIDQLQMIKKNCGPDCPVLVEGLKSMVTADKDENPVPVLVGTVSGGEEVWCWSIDRISFGLDQNTEPHSEEDFLMVNPSVFTVGSDKI